MNEQNQGMDDVDLKEELSDKVNEGRDDYFMDIDRMINEGLGGGNVTLHNGLIDASTTDTMDEIE
jgi:hypothetical protein